MTRRTPSPAWLTAWRERVREHVDALSPRQRQYGLLLAILGGGIGLLWTVFALTASPPQKSAEAASGGPGSVTNIGILPPGGQLNPVDQWVGNAGRKLAQYESEREEQSRLNKDRQSFEARTMQRFAEIEQRLTSAQQSVAPPFAPAGPAATVPPDPTGTSVAPQAPALPPPLPLRQIADPAQLGAATRPRSGETGAQWDAPPPLPPFAPAAPREPVINRVSLVDRPRDPPRDAPRDPVRDPPREVVMRADPSPQSEQTREDRTVTSFLPVSFTRGTLLGGLDAPTGGQSQANPHPVLIRLADNSVLPNQFRAEFRDCFVIAAGYGDISSERAYLRTESLSCVRADGAVLEVRLQGSVYGEDGKVGMRGRLVTKQGQMLANALLAGVVSGIGQGLATSSTSYSTSALGTIASADTNADAYRAGVGGGVGKALDRLAQYYIKLAENTFPVIEVDAGREIDVVITKGVRLDIPMPGTDHRTRARFAVPETRYQELTQDEQY